MAFMRLGTRIAVINDEKQILLSKRGDFGIWALPGGRVDSGELLHESAVREVREETGLDVEIERAVGLYYQQGRARTNVLYRAKPIGGTLFDRTDEASANNFFSVDDVPEDVFGQFYIDHAYSAETHLYTVETPLWERVQLDLKLRWRWILNLLSGRPEPKFTEFAIYAVGILFNPDYSRMMLLDDELIRVRSDGSQPLQNLLQYEYPLDTAWQWVGLWQDTSRDTMEFVFMAVEHALSTMWMKVNELQNRRDRRYVQEAKKRRKQVWFLTE